MSYAAGYPHELPRWYKWTRDEGSASAVEVWERQSAVAYVGRGGAHVAVGEYAVHFDGNGTLAFGGDAVEVASSFDDAAMRGRYVVNVSTAAHGVEIRLTYTDPSTPLHRIRVVRVGDEVRTRHVRRRRVPLLGGLFGPVVLRARRAAEREQHLRPQPRQPGRRELGLR